MSCTGYQNIRFDDWIVNYDGALMVGKGGGASRSSFLSFDINTCILSGSCRRFDGSTMQSSIDLTPYVHKQYGVFGGVGFWTLSWNTSALIPVNDNNQKNFRW